MCLQYPVEKWEKNAAPQGNGGKLLPAAAISAGITRLLAPVELCLENGLCAEPCAVVSWWLPSASGSQPKAGI